MAEKDKKKKDPNEERQKEHANDIYRSRLKYLKQAQILYREDKISQAVDNYYKYLAILANNYNTTEEKLSPTLFDPEKDISELLLISHVYWDLAKAFDRSPHHQRECLRCLDQFTKFSIGFKYQHVNAQIIRKFNNKKYAHNLKAFDQAYTKIHISSKKCYLATYAFGEEHFITNDLRQFKLILQKYSWGLAFIKFYYRFSVFLIEISTRQKIGGLILYYFSRSMIYPIHKVIKYVFNL